MLRAVYRYVPFGQTGSGEGSLNMVSMASRELLFLKRFIAAETGRVRQFPIVDTTNIWVKQKNTLYNVGDTGNIKWMGARGILC